MKRIGRVVSTLLLVVSCNQASSGGGSEPASSGDSKKKPKKPEPVTTAESVVGSWRSTCILDPTIPATATPEYTQSTLTIESGGQLTSQTEHYQDEACADASKIVWTDKQIGTSTFGSVSKSVEGSLDFDLAITKFIVQPRLPDKAKALEALSELGIKKPACKTLTFQPSQETDLTACIEPPTTYRLIKVVGKKLQLGSCYGQNNCASKETRSKTLDVIVYSKI
ncbi:MAG: hypothetical protein FJ146_06850 [Deltaproteobacteria bacterium]|nr:hypothetical protein [Deltaproteobacteria bacterium]